MVRSYCKDTLASLVEGTKPSRLFENPPYKIRGDVSSGQGCFSVT